MEDWYHISQKQIEDFGGSGLLKHFGVSPSKMIKSIYYWYPWDDFQFKFKPSGFWECLKNQKSFLDRLGDQLGFKEMTDWYKITAKQIIEHGGSPALEKYGFSPSKLIISIYNEHNWNISQFTTIGGYWDQKENQREFLNNLGKQLGFTHMDDWYGVKEKQIFEHKGGHLLSKYGITSKMIRLVYSEYPWKESNFRTLDRLNIKHWDKKENRIELIVHLKNRLQIIDLDEWYRVSFLQMNAHYKHMNVFNKYPLETLLCEVYPQHEWNIIKLKGNPLRASQRWLKVMTQSIFPQSEIYENFLHKDLRYANTDFPMELDVFLPNESLALEYQGQQHYRDIYGFGNHQENVQRDKEKRKSCEDHGITLLEIPFWWDNNIESLTATIQQRRKDLILDEIDGEPILSTPPHQFLLGNLPELMHGEDWNGNEDLTGWWISEKLDGMRAYWNGSSLMSRNGKEISCPLWFVENLPKDISLDGELWLEKGKFELLNGMVHSGKEKPLWKQTFYMVFDLPNSKEPFESRTVQLSSLPFPSHVQAVDIERCRGKRHLEGRLMETLKLGGEGLMVNEPNSEYLAKRTRRLLKIKPHNDIEVQLLEVLPSGLYCLQSNGSECMVGCSPQIIESPPSIGSLLTVKYSDYYKSGTLRHAFFWRTKIDQLTQSNKAKSFFWKRKWHSFHRIVSTKAIWTKWENQRDFFDHLGCQFKYQTLEAFYNIDPEIIFDYGGKALLRNMYNNSLFEVFQTIYPNHPWHVWKVSQKIVQGYWYNQDHQRNLLDWLGKELGFKQMEDWYHLTWKQMTQNTRHLQNIYGNIPSIIRNVYNEHHWEESNFHIVIPTNVP